MVFAVNGMTALVATSLFFGAFYENQRADLERTMGLVSNVAMARYSGYMDRAQAILETVATDRDVRSFFVGHEILRHYSRQDARRRLTQLIESNPSVGDIVLSSTNEEVSMIGCKTSERTRTGSYVFGCDNQRAYKQVTASAGNSVQVDLLVDLQRYVETRVAPLLAESGDRLVLVGPDQTVLAVTGMPLEEGQEWVDGDKLLASDHSEKATRHGSYYTFLLSGDEISFLLVSPAASFHERLMATGRWALLAVVLLILIPGFVGLVLSRSLSRRLRDLATASRLLDAHREVHIDTSGDDEVSELARALLAWNERVRRSTEQLEERVRQRTSTIERQKRELERLNERLGEMAAQDALTGLYNRRAFEERAEALLALARREGRSIGVAMIDIDHFKTVNDRHGHLTGDEALRAVATLLLGCFRRESDVVARYGGEEFAVITCAADVEEGFPAQLEDMRHRVAETPTVTDRASVWLTVSCGGVTGVPTTGDDVERFLRGADKALYWAKELGRNRVIVSDHSGSVAGR
jgi:diguanylate cyclase (GGDEF)-like protein